MLYDQKQSKTVLGFLSWLEAQDQDKRYDFMRPDKCAFAQWSGKTVLSKQLDEFYPGLCLVLNRATTFGGAARGLRELLTTR